MIGLLQRVSRASVHIDGQMCAQIARGLLVLIAVQPADDEARADRLLQRLLGYRVFEDDRGRMNQSLIDVRGGLLLVPQFTLAADTRKGMRAGFQSAASPELGCRLFDYLLQQARQQYQPVAAGQFAADMQVSLVNDGPVTFWLEC
ncbi:MAG: D-tyrosyl-tRNA(Tyr) deacylase [gamma proteobacterium symbiont of Bathyaustriella thionipta]|nr:D-tyrosyl-tRNA(Tyr) deacylase [gamma proteobacterium symbiont of Bathyaustriella thionipta]